MSEEFNLLDMTDTEIRELLGYEPHEGDVVRLERTESGYMDEKGNTLSAQHICNNAHFIDGDRGAIIYE